MGIADAYLAELDAPNDDWDRGHAAELLESLSGASAVVREEELLRFAARPVTPFAIKFAAGHWPGTNAVDDATWAATAAVARRRLAVVRQAGIEVAMSDLGLRVLEWIDARIGSRDDQPFQVGVPARIDELLDARRRGRERGWQPRERGSQDPTPSCGACWLLRHPGDHYLRRARARSRDDRLRELLDEQIARLADSYHRLCIHHDAHEQSTLVVELGVLGPLAPGWREPLATTVLRAHTGEVSVGDQLRLRLVADPDARFNGKLVTLRPGERWMAYAHRLADGTIIPSDGTRRLAA
jgi:hypothetical protein